MYAVIVQSETDSSFESPPLTDTLPVVQLAKALVDVPGIVPELALAANRHITLVELPVVPAASETVMTPADAPLQAKSRGCPLFTRKLSGAVGNVGFVTIAWATPATCVLNAGTSAPSAEMESTAPPDHKTSCSDTGG